MEYRCKTIPFTQLIAGPSGFIVPLCNRCATSDCTNPVENRKVSILGITKKARVYIRGVDAHIVVECQGFTNG
jgi:hypothetical protein